VGAAVAEAEAAEALYVYGVVRKKRLPRRFAERGIRLVSSGRLGALVSELQSSPVESQRRNLLRHAEIVEDAFETTAVLPMRFGVVLEDEADVRKRLLAPNREWFESLLEELGDKVELSLKGSYDEQGVLSELLRDNPPLARLRERSRSSFDDRLRLGEEVAAALGRRRDEDAARILRALQPVSRAVRAGEVAVENGLVNLAFLVERDRVEEFNRSLDELGRELSPPAHFKLTGPLPPYSFVDAVQAVSA
jgi:hypothetical protein